MTILLDGVSYLAEKINKHSFIPQESIAIFGNIVKILTTSHFKYIGSEINNTENKKSIDNFKDCEYYFSIPLVTKNLDYYKSLKNNYDNQLINGQEVLFIDEHIT